MFVIVGSTSAAQMATKQDGRVHGDESLVIGIEDPTSADVRNLLATHLAFAHDVTPEGHVHALPLDAHREPNMTLFGARRDGVLVGIGALKQFDATHAEIKSMHIAAVARGRGIGAAVLGRLVAAAREHGYERVSLETGTMDAFATARRLYVRAGFVPCPPFGTYTANPHSMCMTLALDP
jgi:putative acetyltransferase